LIEMSRTSVTTCSGGAAALRLVSAAALGSAGAPGAAVVGADGGEAASVGGALKPCVLAEAASAAPGGAAAAGLEAACGTASPNAFADLPSADSVLLLGAGVSG
jgi:hypothetical protein